MYPLQPLANFVNWVEVPKCFSDNECGKIISIFHEDKIEKGQTRGSHQDDKVRKNTIIWASNDQKYEWIYQRIAAIVTHNNNIFWKLDLSGIETLQFTRYTDVDDHYTTHTDSHPSITPRKLTMSIQLSTAESYTGGEMEVYASGSEFCKMKKDRGEGILFPSFLPHRVMPLKSGERFSLVAWILGPQLR